MPRMWHWQTMKSGENYWVNVWQLPDNNYEPDQVR